MRGPLSCVTSQPKSETAFQTMSMMLHAQGDQLRCLCSLPLQACTAMYWKHSRMNWLPPFLKAIDSILILPSDSCTASLQREVADAIGCMFQVQAWQQGMCCFRAKTFLLVHILFCGERVHPSLGSD